MTAFASVKNCVFPARESFSVISPPVGARKNPFRGAIREEKGLMCPLYFSSSSPQIGSFAETKKEHFLKLPFTYSKKPPKVLRPFPTVPIFPSMRVRTNNELLGFSFFIVITLLFCNAKCYFL